MRKITRVAGTLGSSAFCPRCHRRLTMAKIRHTCEIGCVVCPIVIVFAPPVEQDGQ